MATFPKSLSRLISDLGQKLDSLYSSPMPQPVFCAVYKTRAMQYFHTRDYASKYPPYLKPVRKFIGIARKAESPAAWKQLLSQKTDTLCCVVSCFSLLPKYLFVLLETSKASK